MHGWARIAGVLVAVIVIASFLAAPAFPLVLAPAERLTNGNFEAGFASEGVALGWQPVGQGEARLKWSAESAEPAVWDGAQAQRLSILGAVASAANAEEYIGICQSVDVTPGETYQLTVRGALLADADAQTAGVSAQWGLDPTGGTWAGDVREWITLPWEPASNDKVPGALRAYFTTFTATTERLTLFLRVYKPANSAIRQLDLLLDGLSLRGSQSAPTAGVVGFRGPTVSITAPTFPVVGGSVFLHVLATHSAGVLSVRLFDDGIEIGRVERTAPATALEESFVWTPQSAGTHRLRAEASNLAGEVGMAVQTMTVGEVMALVETGADDGLPIPGWEVFAAGGQATLSDAGLLRLAGAGRPLAGEACYAGIYRQIEGMRPGATYDLRLSGRLGEPKPAERWSAEYAIAWTNADAALQALEQLDWQALPWPVGGVGPLPMYTTSLIAQGAQATLLLRARRLAGAERCEGEMTIASVSVRGYQ